MNKYEKMFKEARENSLPSWVEVAVRPLAADIEEYTGLPTKLFGPCGLRSEVILTVGEDKEHRKGKCLTLTPSFEDGEDGEDGFKIFYDTGEKTTRCPPGSLGEMNGFNNMEAPLPDTLEEICQLLRPLYDEEGQTE